MARPQTWDEEELLKGVMALFREKGFAQTSVRDLERVTRLHPGSLYKAYGSKDGLFVAALRAYNQRVVALRVETHLTAPVDALAGIRSFFTSTFEDGAPVRTEPGCLVTNTAIEGFSLETEARSEVAAGLGAIERGLSRAVERARASGQLDTDAGTASIAAQLLALYQGVLVLVRSGAPRAKLSAITRDGLRSVLRPVAPTKQKKGRQRT
jgi:AcrR family transcriptional regulator